MTNNSTHIKRQQQWEVVYRVVLLAAILSLVFAALRANNLWVSIGAFLLAAAAAVMMSPSWIHGDSERKGGDS